MVEASAHISSVKSLFFLIFFTITCSLMVKMTVMVMMMMSVIRWM